MEEHRSLRSLSVIEAARLLRHHDISESVQSIIEKERVDGRMLEDAEEVDDFVGIGISKLHSKSLLRIVGEAREKGVPLSWLQQVIPAPAPAPAPALAPLLAVDWTQAYDRYHRACYLDDAVPNVWLEQQAAAGNEAAKAYHMLLMCIKDKSRACDMGAELQREALPRWLESRDTTEQMHAQFIMGHCYYSALGCDEDYSQALTLWRRSADQGHAQAQYMLGVCYEEGHGVPWDFNQSVSWYRIAADHGHVRAQYLVAFFYTYGQGVTEDRAIGLAWYRKAAEQGYRDAMSALES